MLRRTTLSLAVAAAALVTLTACGSGPGLPKEAAAGDSPVPPDQVTALVQKSVDAATAIHVHGGVPDGDDLVGMDLHLNLKDGSASGSIILKGFDYPVIETTDHALYIQITAGTAFDLSHDPKVQALQTNKWVPSTSPLVAGERDQLKRYLDLKHILNGVGGLLHGTVESAGDDWVDVRGHGDVYKDSAGRKMYLAKSAPHDLMRIDGNPGYCQDRVYFSDWNKSVPVSAPPADQMYTGPGA